MIVVLRAGASEEQIADVSRRIQGMGYRAHVSRGEAKHMIALLAPSRSERMMDWRVADDASCPLRMGRAGSVFRVPPPFGDMNIKIIAAIERPRTAPMIKVRFLFLA